MALKRKVKSFPPKWQPRGGFSAKTGNKTYQLLYRESKFHKADQHGNKVAGW
jgi:hypothetical protein